MRNIRFDVYSGCLGKTKHHTYQDAVNSLNKSHSLKRNPRHGADKATGKIIIYKCRNHKPFTHYHIGKSAKHVPKPYRRDKYVPAE